MSKGLNIVAVGALLAGWPAAAPAVPLGGASRVGADGPGDQADATLDANLLVFAQGGAGGAEVVLADLASGTLQVVAEGADQPDLARNVLAHRTPAGIALRFALTGALLRVPAEPGAGSPAVSVALAAWEEGPAGERDIAWYQLVSGLSGVLAAPGDQRAPAVAGNVVAWIDDAAGGRVLLHDLARAETRVVCDGVATSIAIAGAGDLLRVAVARGAPGEDADIEVWDGAGVRLAALDQPGEQRNPRLAGAWVAFEDLSTGRPVVVLWNTLTGLTYVPRAATAAQALGDVDASLTLLSLAFSESNGSDLDLLLYTLPLPAEDDGTGSDWPPKEPPVPPARCDDPGATVLASLLVGRDANETEAGEVSFTTGDGKDLPVLLCVDEERVDEGWVAFDGEVVASPADFVAAGAHLERKRLARGGEALVSAVLAPELGARLTVRVLADPGQVPATGAGGGQGQGGGGAPPAQPSGHARPVVVPEAPAPPAAGGCGTGPSGPLALLALSVNLAAVRRRRRAGAPSQRMRVA